MPGIKVIKPKISVAADATSTKRPTDLSQVGKNYSDSLSKMTDKELSNEIIKQGKDNIDFNTLKYTNPRAGEAVDSLASRNIKKRGGYKMGTKGIKIKGK